MVISDARPEWMKSIARRTERVRLVVVFALVAGALGLMIYLIQGLK